MFPPLIFTGFLAAYITAETFSLNVEKLIIKDPQLPANFNNLKVCFISDIHHGPMSSRRRLVHMVRKINDLDVDLILLGGDYLQTFKNSTPRIERAFHELIEIFSHFRQPKFGIYAVLGNHDHLFNPRIFCREFDKIGIKVIDNDGVFLKKDGQRIRLGGVGDLWFDRQDLQAALGSSQNDFVMLLSHQPNFIDSLKPEDGVNFVLAGHTHGGQFRIFNYMPFLPKKIARWEYTVGLVETPQARMLVSPGVGNVIPYFRFFSPPKIHLLVFKSAPRLSPLTHRLS